MLEQGLTALVAADSTLASLIGTRFYPVLVPEGTAYPCVSYQEVSAVSGYTFSTETTEKRMQFDVWATSYASAKTVAKALRALLDGYTGTLTDGTKVLGSFRVLELDEYEPDTRTYRVIADYRFLYREAN